MTDGEAFERLLRAYAPAAVYVVPAVFARHLKLSAASLNAALDRLVTAGRMRPATVPGQKGDVHVWG